MKAKFSSFVKFIPIIILMVVVATAFVGCAKNYDDQILTKEEKEEVQKELLRSIEEFSFDNNVCNAKDPKIIINVAEGSRSYAIPSQDKIIVPKGVKMEMYKGESKDNLHVSYGSFVEIDENGIGLITVVLSKSSEKVEISIVLNNNPDITKYYMTIVKNSNVRFFNGNGYEIQYADQFITEGSSFRFSVALINGEVGSKIKVYLDGEELEAGKDNSYIVTNVTANHTVTTSIE